MTNEHVIDKDIINNHNNIDIYYDSEFKVANVKLDEKERYIKSFRDIGLDITVVEIIEKNNIYRDYFLFPEAYIANNIVNCIVMEYLSISLKKASFFLLYPNILSWNNF